MTATITPTPTPRPGSGIRVATAIVGGSIALLAIVAASIGQFAVVGAASSTTTEAIPTSITSVEVVNAVGDVGVFSTPGAEPGVEIRVDAFALSRVTAPEVRVEGDALSIAVPERTGPCWFTCWGSVTILVELGGIELDSLDLASDVGTIAVTDVVAERIDAGSDVGDVRVSGADAREIVTSSDVGTIEVEALESTRSIGAVSAVGDVRILVPAGVDYAITTSTDVGDVSLRGLASVGTAERAIEASSDVGSIVVEVR